jgi:hypothetical protein
MAWADFTINRSAFRVRPGLLLFFIAFLFLWLCGLTTIPGILGKGPSIGRIVALFVATVALTVGSLFLYRDSGSYHSLQMWVTLVAMISLAISIPTFVLFAMVTLRSLMSSHVLFVVSNILTRLREPLAGVAWIGSFFGRGRSRLALVVGSTLMIVLWGSTAS